MGKDDKKLAPPPPSGVRRHWDWMTSFNGVLALFAVLSFVVLWIQLCDARKSFAIQIGEARKSFASDQRPYVWLANDKDSSPSLKVVPEKNPAGALQFVGDLYYTNYGKSPAIILRQYHGLILGPNAAKIRPLQWQEAKMILPTGKIDEFSPLSGVVTEKEVSTYMSAMENDGLTVYATWQYMDTAGNKYETELCLTRLNRGGWAYCKEHNDIKDCSLDVCEQ